MNSDQTKMKEFIDKQEIHEVIVRYCRAVDRCDQELLASCYHPDAMDDHGGWSQPASVVSTKLLGRVRELSHAATHLLGNCTIDLQGDIAFTESYFQANLEFEREGKRFLRMRAGRYIDRFERRMGEWKIAERVVADDWNRIDPVVERVPGDLRFGKRDKTDLSYTIKEGRVARQQF